jgi:mevalonate kinase
MKIKITIPSKIIISGEHSVLYNCPAIITSIDLYLYTELDVIKSEKPYLALNLSNFDLIREFQIKDCFQIYLDIKSRYELFVRQKLDIKKVLTNPLELVVYTIVHFWKTNDIAPQEAISIDIKSNIPIGCGLGSSASLIIGTVKLLNKYYKTNLNTSILYQMALECENLQHSKSSGVDVYTVLNNGCFYRFKNIYTPINKIAFKYYLVNTGTPESSTGECVKHVADRFANNFNLWQEFDKTTKDIKKSIMNNDINLFKTLVKNNNTLLYKVGVVSDKTQQFLKELEDRYNGAGKVCGAGTVKGEGSGTILLISDKKPLKLINKYNYKLIYEN